MNRILHISHARNFVVTLVVASAALVAGCTVQADAQSEDTGSSSAASSAFCGHHFYTTSADEAASAQHLGFSAEGITGFLYDSGQIGTVPFYRLFNGRISDHLYTTSDTERRQAAAAGYADEGIIGYIHATPKGLTTPLYRLYNGGISDHFYTTSYDEANAAKRLGYAYEGIAGYLLLRADATQTGLAGLVAAMYNKHLLSVHRLWFGNNCDPFTLGDVFNWLAGGNSGSGGAPSTEQNCDKAGLYCCPGTSTSPMHCNNGLVCVTGVCHTRCSDNSNCPKTQPYCAKEAGFADYCM